MYYLDVNIMVDIFFLEQSTIWILKDHLNVHHENDCFHIDWVTNASNTKV